MFKRLWSVCMLTSALLLATTCTYATEARMVSSQDGSWSLEIQKSGTRASWTAPAPTPTMTPEPGDDDIPSRNGTPATRRTGQIGTSSNASLEQSNPVARSWNLDDLLQSWRLRLLMILRASR